MTVEELSSHRIFRGGVCVQAHRPTCAGGTLGGEVPSALARVSPLPALSHVPPSRGGRMLSSLRSRVQMSPPAPRWGSAPPNTRAELFEEGGAVVVSLGDMPPGTYRHDVEKGF